MEQVDGEELDRPLELRIELPLGHLLDSSLQLLFKTAVSNLRRRNEAVHVLSGCDVPYRC